MSPPPADAVVPAARDRAADALVAADLWSLWRTLARGLAHGLANASQMLALEPTPPVARAEAASHVALAQARLAEVSRRESGGPTLIPDVLDDLQVLQRLQAGYPSVELALDVVPGLPAVAISDADLRHVLLALVTNAKEAVPGERATIRIRARAEGDGVAIAVEDGGPGVPRDLRERAFEPYVTTRPGALGLGLAAARTLVERAGGSLVVAPAASCFEVRLPGWRRG